MKLPLTTLPLILSLACASAAEDGKAFALARPLKLDTDSKESVLYFTDGKAGERTAHIHLLKGSATVILTFGNDLHIENELPLGEGNQLTVKGHAIKIRMTGAGEVLGFYQLDAEVQKAEGKAAGAAAAAGSGKKTDANGNNAADGEKVQPGTPED